MVLKNKVNYWHLRLNFNWDINKQVKGWNEALITYVFTASPIYPITK